VKILIGIANKSGRLVQLSRSYYLRKQYEGVLFQGNVEGIGRSEERRHAKSKIAMMSHSHLLKTKFAQQLIVDILTDATISVRKTQSV
jgi:riboflavin synthase alpha subunit